MREDKSGRCRRAVEQACGGTQLIEQESLTTGGYDLSTEAPEEAILVNPDHLILDDTDPFRAFVGTSESVLRIKQLIRKIADSELSVLIRGESGTGKEVVARLIHHLSSRKTAPFVKVNCAALSESLLESELFGHEKGAFTGAHKSRPGRFELAHRGTIFLDEIGDMAYSLQAKSLQVLEQKEFMPVGSNRLVRVDVRIVSATNGVLEEFIENRAFRKDLLYRLNDVTITLPPLRERREDVSFLIRYFLDIYARKYRRPSVPISPSLMDLMTSYDWPGNIRQLESLIKKITILGDESMVEAAIMVECRKAVVPIEIGVSPSSTSVPVGSAPPSAVPETSFVSSDAGGRLPTVAYAKTDEIVPLKEATSEAIRNTEIDLLSRALAKTRWNRREAAKILQISYRSLLYKIKEYDLLDPKGRRGPDPESLDKE